MRRLKIGIPEILMLLTTALFIGGYYAQELFEMGSFERAAFLITSERVSIALAILANMLVIKTRLSRSIALGVCGFVIGDQYTIWMYHGDYGSIWTSVGVMVTIATFETLRIARLKKRKDDNS